jgi:predicted nucleic acid-binding protein
VTDVVLLDSGPLGLISHPRPSRAVIDWIVGLLAAGTEVRVSEIADYEVRRELIRAGGVKGIKRLDRLKSTLGYVPITTEAMLKAAEFWADARRTGRPTASDASLDADVILAGQAATLADQNVIVASTNPKHIARFVPALDWQAITA